MVVERKPDETNKMSFLVLEKHLKENALNLEISEKQH